MKQKYFKEKPIPKGKIEWAIKQTKSMSSASRTLGVSYNTFKKYAKRYELFETNQCGKGIKKPKKPWKSFSSNVFFDTNRLLELQR
jgi:hypothetical protein